MAEAQKIPTRSGKPRTLFAPLAGGPVFVPIVDSIPNAELAPKLVQADINAAINLALRAIADPRLWTIHPRLRSQREGGNKPGKAKMQKAKKEASDAPTEVKLLTREKRKFGESGKPLVIKHASSAKPDDTRQPNFFADLAGLNELAEQLAKKNPREYSWLTKEWTSAEISGENTTPPLVHGKSFWGTVKAKQWERIRAINSARLAAWHSKGDDVSM
jgi:hypothetical protein